MLDWIYQILALHNFLPLIQSFSGVKITFW